MTSGADTTNPRLPDGLIPATPETRIALALRLGRIQLAAYARTHGLTLRQAAEALAAQSQRTRRESACMRAPEAP